MIREATERDIQFLIDIEMAALPHDFLPRLGKKFLGEYFFPAVLRSKHAFTIVNVDNEIANAFVIFAYNTYALNSQIMMNKSVLVKYVFLGFIKDVTIILEILAIIRGFKTEINSNNRINIKEIPELYLIATAPEMQSKGIGKGILSKGLEMLHEKGFNKSLVKTSSDRARLFYLKNHYEEIGVEFRGKRKLYLLLHTHDQ